MPAEQSPDYKRERAAEVVSVYMLPQLVADAYA